MKSWHTQKLILKNVHFHAHVRVSGGWEKESVSSQHFYLVVPEPIDFCILKKLANCSTPFIFQCLIHHFLARHSFLSSVHSLLSCGSGRLMKTRPQPPSKKRLRNSCNRHSGISGQISMYCEILTRLRCNVCRILCQSCWHV